MAGAVLADPIGDDELASWLRLTETPGVGPAITRRLLGAFGLPDAVFTASRAELLHVVSPAIADALRTAPPSSLASLVDRTAAWLREPGNHLLTLADTRYPAVLLEATDPPTILYVKGRLDRLDASLFAIVGSRNATSQGRIDARRFAEALAGAGHTIVSGLALGIDAAAHEGALAADPDGGSTVAVIGTGIDIVYPAAHRALAHRIAASGAIVSELPLGTTASAHQFPRRNRLIAGLARGVLVVEAAARSGSLITARLAAEAGRDVFAMPGSIHAPLAKGCHQLIRQGAMLVDVVDDILGECAPAAGVSTVAAVAAVGRAVRGASRTAAVDPSIDALSGTFGFEPVTADELSTRSGLDAARVSTLLLDLELAGRVARLPGGRFQRLAP